MLMTKKQHAYEYIKKSVVNGLFSPNERIREEELSRQLSVSRGPLREAISELVCEGLLEKTPGIGVHVRNLTREELVELYELREALESFIAAKAAENNRNGLVHDLTEALNKQKIIARSLNETQDGEAHEELRRAWLKTDRQFHRSLYDSFGNKSIKRLVDEQSTLMRVFQQKDVDHSTDFEYGQSRIKNLSMTMLEHSRLIRAIKRGRPESARRLAVEHVRRAAENHLKLFDAARAAVEFSA